MNIALFIVGLLLYAGAVYGALFKAFNYANPDDKNIVYGCLAGVLIGAVLTIVGFMKLTKPEQD